MAEIKVTLHAVTREIEKVQKKLKGIRRRVSSADQKKIDLQMRSLKKCANEVKHFCSPPAQGFIQMFPIVKK
jgi:hypothetical protein